MNDKPLTFKFKFRAPASQKPVPPLNIDFGKRVSTPEVVKMMMEGKMPIPDSWHNLSKQQLSDLGYPKVRWSKLYKCKYVEVNCRAANQYDS